MDDTLINTLDAQRLDYFIHILFCSDKLSEDTDESGKSLKKNQSVLKPDFRTGMFAMSHFYRRYTLWSPWSLGAGLIEMSNPSDIENTTLTEGIFNIQIHFQ